MPAVLLRAHGDSVFCDPNTKDAALVLLGAEAGHDELTIIRYGVAGVLLIQTRKQRDVGCELNKNASTIAKTQVRGDALAFPYGLPWAQREEPTEGS